MNDNQWNQCSDPEAMLPLIGDRATKRNKRKLRLFAVACCLHQIGLLSDELRQSVLIAEQFADGLIDDLQLQRTHQQSRLVLDAFPDPDAWHALSVYDQDRTEAKRNAAWAVVDATQEMAWQAAEDTSVAAASSAAWVARMESGHSVLGKARDAAANRGYDDERAVQAAILRDIFGNLFRDRSVASASRQESALILARVIYEQKAFQRMNELAKILEQTETPGAEASSHCRSVGPHVRGCWVIDELIEKGEE
jgi:hypothetical protein